MPYEVEHRVLWPDGTARGLLEKGAVVRNENDEPVQMLGVVQDVTERVTFAQRLRESEERFLFAVEGAGDAIWDWNLASGEMVFSELFLILCRGTVVSRDEAGKPLRMIGIHSDISARKHDELALRAARDEARRASRAKSEFLSSMSHELRTPLNAILGFAQLMEYDDTLPTEHLDNVHEILKAGRHLLSLIGEILDLAQIEAGRLKLSLEAVEIGPLTEDCFSIMGVQARQRRISLQRRGPPNGVVCADRTRLKQVLLNLLSNAVKYNRDGGRITLTVAAPEDEGPAAARRQ